jgi:hypothetical protein
MEKPERSVPVENIKGGDRPEIDSIDRVNFISHLFNNGIGSADVVARRSVAEGLLGLLAIRQFKDEQFIPALMHSFDSIEGILQTTSGKVTRFPDLRMAVLEHFPKLTDQEAKELEDMLTRVTQGKEE